MKRETEITLPNGETFGVDYDDLLRELKDAGEEAIYQELGDGVYWDIARPWMKKDAGGTEKFRVEFVKMTENRMGVIYGNVTVSHDDSKRMMNRAYALGESDDPTKNKRSAILLGFEFAEMMKQNDLTKLSQIMKMMKLKKSPPSKQGGLDSQRGRLWKSFCKCHLVNLEIPSKTDVMVAAEIKIDFADLKKSAMEDLAFIGLGGLPE